MPFSVPLDDVELHVICLDSFDEDWQRFLRSFGVSATSTSRPIHLNQKREKHVNQRQNLTVSHMRRSNLCATASFVRTMSCTLDFVDDPEREVHDT